MTATVPTRFDAELFEQARSVGKAAHRSAAQQLAHWARLGREVESATDLSARDLTQLATARYDDLSPAAQAIARVEMREEADLAVAGLDMRARLAGRARTSSADAEGNVSVHRGSTQTA